MRLGIVVFVLAVAGGIARADESGEAGVPLPKKSRPVAAYTWISGDNFRDTLKFFAKRWKDRPYTIHRVMSNEKLRVVHLASDDPSTGWSGVNISEKKRQVRIFILPRKQ